MFFIYSLNLDDLTIKIYDFCQTKNTVDTLVDTVATSFIRKESGDRRAEHPYFDDVTDDQITEDGYFLRHSKSKPHEIEVYVRKTEVIAGRLWNSFTVTCRKVMHFSVTEASIGLPIEHTGRGVTSKTFATAHDAQQHANHLDALKQRLISQKLKVDSQINSGLDSQIDQTVEARKVAQITETKRSSGEHLMRTLINECLAHKTNVDFDDDSDEEEPEIFAYNTVEDSDDEESESDDVEYTQSTIRSNNVNTDDEWFPSLNVRNPPTLPSTSSSYFSPAPCLIDSVVIPIPPPLPRPLSFSSGF